MKNTLRNLLTLREAKGDVGIEIEAQGRRMPSPDYTNDTFRKYWRVETDGSLKGGYESWEYVFQKPLTIKGVDNALNSLEQAYRELGSDVADTVYAGVHVHINVQRLTPKQVFTYITAYYMIEELITTFCGPTRQGNHFCLRGIDAENGPITLATAARERNIHILNTDQLRYGAMNPRSLFSYGSLEFRAMRSTRHLPDIYAWANLLLNLRNNVTGKFEDPIDLINSVSGNANREFLEILIGNSAAMFHMNEGEIAEMIMRGTRLIQEVAYATDWSQYRDRTVSPFKKEI